MEKARRVMLKLSGEALAGKDREEKELYCEETVRLVARQVREAADEGVQIGIVIGGGNIWRGRTGKAIDRPKSDQIGMLATVMNCIFVSEIFRSEGMRTEIFTPFVCGSFTKLFSKDEAVAALNDGKIVFFAGGTGHPYFSTDTGVVLRAVEVEADQILLAKSVDGIYDCDPAIHPEAKKFDTISIREVVDRRLDVIDHTASIFCMDNHMPLAVFDMRTENSIRQALKGSVNGTIVTA